MEWSDLHQVYCILCVPLKEVRREVSFRRTRTPVTTGVETNNGKHLLVQRLQLRTKVGQSAS